MKAMILAAGRGERMRPLSHSTPKPLLKIGDTSLIEHHLHALKEAGVQEVIINVSYHPQQFVQKLGNGERYGLKLFFSFEEDAPLGTGGGIFKALPLLGSDPFIVISADIWTDFPIAKLKAQPTSLKDAHLVMVENREFHPNGDFCLQKNGMISLDSPKLTYGNIAVLHPRLFAQQRSGEFPLAPILYAAIRENKVSGELYQGVWNNIGTPEQLEQLRASQLNSLSR